MNTERTAIDTRLLQGFRWTYLEVGALPTAQGAAHTAQEVAHSPRRSPAAALPSCQVAEAPPSFLGEVHLPIRPAHRVDERTHTACKPCTMCMVQ